MKLKQSRMTGDNTFALLTYVLNNQNKKQPTWSIEVDCLSIIT